MPTYLITGVNRGLGLEFVRQLAQDPSNTIIATTRRGADRSDLESVSSKTTHIFDLDTTSADSILSLASALTTKLDFIIANAGANTVPHQTVLDLDRDDLHREMDTNVLGPAMLTATLLERGLLADNVRIVNMTSGLASMTYSLTKTAPECATYSISKAGLNMVTVHQSSVLREKVGKGCVVVCMDPGWVRTRMGGDKAALDAVSLVVYWFGVRVRLGGRWLLTWYYCRKRVFAVC